MLYLRPGLGVKIRASMDSTLSNHCVQAFVLHSLSHTPRHRKDVLVKHCIVVIVVKRWKGGKVERYAGHTSFAQHDVVCFSCVFDRIEHACESWFMSG